MGLGGSTVGGVWAIRRCRKLPKTGSDNRVWQFTLRDLFWRTTVFAMLVAAWTSIIRWFVSDIH